ncbi:MAG: RluA family pseudouridine synthase [Burkholderiaceae bacterium]|nr:RluA family pseudouridine synthase [Burkholderiaceae bacterium]
MRRCGPGPQAGIPAASLAQEPGDEDSFAEEIGELAAAPIELRHIEVNAAQHGARLDRALAELVPEFSRSYLQQLLAQGLVRRNGQPAPKAAARVHAGDRLQVELRPTQQSQAFKPQVLPLDVVYEDAHLLVIHKPAGMVVHPAPGNWSGTLLNGLLARDPKAFEVPRAGIVHRLDKDTSGLLVVARERSTMDALVRMIAARSVRREYQALAHHRWAGPKLRRIDAPIGRDPRNRLRMAVVDLSVHAGKPACTDVRWLGGDDSFCWVECSLHTGRTHQIRVHLASIGHPLVADALYGGAPALGLQRQALHAWRLAFTHPVTGQAMEFVAPLPQDLRQALQRLGYNPP